MEKQETRYCQSCGMPLTEELLGTEQNGEKNTKYCLYCYQGGAFTADVTIEEMVEICLDHTPGQDYSLYGCKDREEARGRLLEWFPTLGRWKKPL